MNTFYLDTPFSVLRVDCSEDEVLGLEYVARGGKQAPSGPFQKRIADQIRAYLKSPANGFDLPLHTNGTLFQQRVWAALLSIPVGQVRSYGDIAAELNSSARAVGNACRANPIPLIIPCHRVVAAAGIGGFSGKTAGARITLKRRLLAHEGVEI